MTAQQILEDDWTRIKEQLRQRWAQLTDKDLPAVRGDVDHLVEVIQRKTGEGREAIEAFLQRLSGEATSAMGTAAETARDCTQHAVESVQHTAHQAADQLRAGYEGAERLVRKRPGESLAVCFGVGLITGVVIALVLRSR